MRTIIFALTLSFAACASGPRAVNVAAVRSEINGTIQASSADRTVTAMGKTSTERAVVYTTLWSGDRQEETWVKTGGGWKLEAATAVSSTN